jgi:hypothetical protein
VSDEPTIGHGEGELGPWMRHPQSTDPADPPHKRPGETRAALSAIYADDESYRRHDAGGIVAVRDWDGCEAIVRSIRKAP